MIEEGETDRKIIAQAMTDYYAKSGEFEIDNILDDLIPEAPEFPILTQMSLHGCKDGNHEDGVELGLTGQALKNFTYALYEVIFDVRIQEDGSVSILSVNGVDLQTPVGG